MEEEFPPRPTPLEAALLIRRKRGRNVALLIVLMCVAALFFAVTLVKLSRI